STVADERNRGNGRGSRRVGTSPVAPTAAWSPTGPLARGPPHGRRRPMVHNGAPCTLPIPPIPPIPPLPPVPPHLPAPRAGPARPRPAARSWAPVGPHWSTAPVHDPAAPAAPADPADPADPAGPSGPARPVAPARPAVAPDARRARWAVSLLFFLNGASFSAI